MLTTEETEYVFSGHQKSVVVDVGAAPGGWTQYLANLQQVKRSLYKQLIQNKSKNLYYVIYSCRLGATQKN